MGGSNDLSNVTTIDIWNRKLKLEITKSPNLQKRWGLTVWKGEVHEVDADTSQSKINNFEALKITKNILRRKKHREKQKLRKVHKLVEVSLTSSHAIDLPC